MLFPSTMNINEKFLKFALTQPENYSDRSQKPFCNRDQNLISAQWYFTL